MNICNVGSLPKKRCLQGQIKTKYNKDENGWSMWSQSYLLRPCIVCVSKEFVTILGWPYSAYHLPTTAHVFGVRESLRLRICSSATKQIPIKLFSVVYGMSSFPLTFIFFKMVIAQTKQLMWSNTWTLIRSDTHATHFGTLVGTLGPPFDQKSITRDAWLRRKWRRTQSWLKKSGQQLGSGWRVRLEDKTVLSSDQSLWLMSYLMVNH